MSLHSRIRFIFTIVNKQIDDHLRVIINLGVISTGIFRIGQMT